VTRRVYFIRPIGMQGPVKIGCSQSPDQRRCTLAAWSPFPLEVVAEIAGGERLERSFHALFAEQHERREWFRWSPELQAVMDAINAGTFDVATLPASDNCISKRKSAADRRQQSLTLRTTYAEKRSGHKAPIAPEGLIAFGVPQVIAELEAWIASTRLAA
jgi:hypothetical protein